MPAKPASRIAVTKDTDGWSVATGLAGPVKMAFAPDGRLFVNELTTGNIRILRADGTLAPDPFATVSVVTGSERGLDQLVNIRWSDHACEAMMRLHLAHRGRHRRGQVIAFDAVPARRTAGGPDAAVAGALLKMILGRARSK